jgi:hypothetical protein
MNIDAKVRHVITAQQTRRHRCHWPDCHKLVPPAKWGCREHWYQLPKILRDKIWAAYRPGQEEDLQPSRRYVEVAREVRRWIKAVIPAQAGIQAGLF